MSCIFALDLDLGFFYPPSSTSANDLCCGTIFLHFNYDDQSSLPTTTHYYYSLCLDQHPSWYFSIACFFSVVPISLIVFGRSLNPKNIREGDDVYFECHVKSNPPFFNITWRQNVRWIKKSNHNQVFFDLAKAISIYRTALVVAAERVANQIDPTLDPIALLSI